MFKLFRKIATLCIVLASTIVVNAQTTQINWGTFVSLRPDLTNQGSSYQRDLASDASGNVFGTGNTNISQAPIGVASGTVVDNTFGGGQWDGYLYKLAADGKSLLWWTYLGGGGNDDIWSVEFSKEGANEYVYCAGFAGANIAVPVGVTVKGAYKSQRDAFLAKFNAITGELVWLSWLGSNKDDCGFGVKVTSNYVHMVGFASKGIPTSTGAYQTTLADDWTYDGFYSRFDFSGNINYCTYTNFSSPFMDINSGNGANGARGIDVLSDNDVIIAGTTYGNDVSTEKNNSALKTTGVVPTAEVGFVLRLNPAGTGANDYLFGSKIRTKNTGYTFGSDVRHSNGSFYVLGYSNDVVANIPTGAFRESNSGAVDVFVLKIKASDYSFENASMYGGAGNDYAAALSVCSFEPTFTGQTASNNLPAVGALITGALSDPTRNMSTFQGGGNDLFVASLQNDFKAVTFSTYLGGTFDEHPFTSYTLNGKTGGHALNGSNLLVGASTHSFSDMPTTTNGMHHFTKTVANNITSPDLDFIVSFAKTGGSCGPSATISPVLDLDASNTLTGTDYDTTYTENNTVGVKIGDSDTKITDTDSPNITGATIVLTNKFPGDTIKVGALTGGILSSVVSTGTTITITLTGNATQVHYQDAIQNIRFSNNSDNPNTTDRKINVTVNDGTDPSNTAIATIKVIGVNDAPLLDLDATAVGTGYSTSYTEQGSGVSISKTSQTTITDIDDTNQESAEINLINGQVGDVLTVTGSTAGFIVANVKTGNNIKITITGSGTNAQYQTLINSIQFSNLNEDPNTTTRNITVFVNDGNANSNTATTLITFTAENDGPSLDLDANNSTATGTSSQKTYTENSLGVQITDVDVSATDVDNSNLSSAIITLSNWFAGDTIKVVGTLPVGITAVTTKVGSTRIITLSGSATKADYETALELIQFSSTSDNPNTTDRIVNFTVSDGALTSSIAVGTIKFTAVNDNPVLDLDDNSNSWSGFTDLTGTGFLVNSYIEKGPDKNIADTDILITDVDNTNLSSATIILTNKQAGDTIKIGTLLGGITSSVVSNPGTITITLSGSTTLANYQTTIRNIVYGNSNSDPSTTDRFVTVQVNDGSAANNLSNIATTTIKFTAVNDNPNIDLDANNSTKTGSDYQTTFTEKGTGVTIGDVDTKVTDVDSPNLTSATIVLTNKQIGDYLVLGTLTGITSTSIDSSVANKITITLTGSTSLLNYENAIKTITFKNGSSSPVTIDRIVTVVVNDGGSVNNISNTATSTIRFTAVNDCPIVDLNTSTNGSNDIVTYFENSSAVNIVGNNISISDPDKTTQAWNVKVELTNAFALDSLFKSANVGSLTIGNPDYTTIPGRISITISGTGTGADLATIISGIKFRSWSDNPDLTPRIITIDVSDDAIPACKVSTISTINIKAKNDCPVVDLNTNSTSDFSTIFVEQGAKVNVTSSNVSITDVDNTTQKWTAKVELTNAVSLDSLFSSVTEIGFTVNPVSYTSGKVTVNITGTGTGVQLGSIIKGITYKSGSLNPDVTTRNIVVSISDDSSCTSTANSTITINQSNDASVLTLDDNNSALTVKKTDFKTTFTEQLTAVNIGDVDTKITDIDNTTQSSATITLTNKKTGDIIKVGALTGGIIASYDSSQVGKVVITLTGVTTLANYQDAIRNINFQNNRDNVDTNTRVIEVTVNDGTTNSNIATSFIKVINVNDTVIVKNESVVTNEDITITNNLSTITSNDVDPDGDVLTVTGIVTNTKNGTINIVGNTYVYDPNKFFFGKDTAVFNVCDPKGACRKDTLFITVNPVSDGLKLDLDVNDDNDKFDSTGYQTTFTENDAHLGIDITDNDVSIFNPDLLNMTTATFILTNKKLGDSLYVNGVLENGLTTSLVSTGNTLTLTVSGLKDSTAYKNLLTQIQFKNNRDDVDTTTRVINVTVANTDGTSNIVQTLIKVVNINDTVIVENEYFTINEETQLNNTLLSLLANDTDPDGDVISIQTIVNYGNNGSFSITSGNFIYNPNKDYNGKDTIVVSVCDTKNACRNDSLFITILPINDNPILDLDKNNNHDNTSTVNYQVNKLSNSPFGPFGENTKQVSIGDADVHITDVDNTSIYSALIKLTNTKVGDSLIVNGTLPNGIKDSLYTIGDTTYIALKGKNTFVNYQNAIKLVNFKHVDAIIDSTDRIIYVTVNDSLLNSNVAITTITIDNRSPLIESDIYVTLEDSVLTNTLADILKNDKDPEGAKLTVSATVKNGSNGTFTTDGTNFTYNPKKDFNGRDTVVVSVCDIKNACKNDTLFITVVPLNDSPLLDLDKNNSTKTGNDYLTKYVENDTALSVGDVDVEITDVDNTTISSSTIKLINSYAGDTLKVNGTIPNGITYTTTKVGDTIVVKFVGKGSLATYQNLIKQTNFSSTKDTLVTTNRFVHVTVNDSVANSNVAITTITLENVNDNPLVTVTNLITKEDTTITGKNKDILVNDKDPEGGKLVIKQVVKDGTNGTFVLTTDSTYSYTPDKDFNGKDTVTVSVCDPQGLCSTKTIIITVIPVNDNPILDLDDDNSSGKTGADYTTTFNENGTSLAINDTDISIKDVDSKNLVSSKIVLTNTKAGDSLVIGTLPNGLTATTSKVGDSTIVSISGTATLLAYQDAISAIKFLNVRDDLDSTTRVIKVTVNDSVSTSNIATTTIKVNSINDDPIIKSDTLTVVEDKSVTKDFKTLLSNDKDPENTTLTVTGIVKNGTKGNVTFTDSTYTYNPNLNVNGKDTVVFTVCDNGFPLPRLCKNDTLFINTIPVNDDPIVKNEYVTIKKNNTGVNVNFINSQDSDVETTLISSGIVKSSTNGKVSNINLTNGTFTYVPDRYFVGKDTVIFTVCDQGLPLPAICKEDTIFITVEENNANCTIIDLDGDNSSKQLGYDYETTFVENSAAINITDKDLYIYDIDENQTELYSAKVVLTNTQAGDSMYYTGPVFPNMTTLVAKVNNNWEITFSGLADTSYYRQAIAQIKFVNNRDDISSVRREIKFTLNDGSTASVNGNCNNSATAYINVVPVHDIALIVNEKITLNEDDVYKNKYTGITSNDYSKDRDSIVVSIKTCKDFLCYLNDTLIVKNGNHGKLTYGTDSVFTYTPNKDFNGKDTVVVKVCDNTMCYNDTLFIDVIPVNDSIIVVNEYHTLNQGQSVSGSIITNDKNPDGTGVKLINNLIVHNNNGVNPLGTLTVFDNGQYTYVANTGVSGTDIYVYTVCSQPGNYSCKYDTLFFKVGGEVIPTGFSPNGNGVNDTYKISFPESYGTASVEIYNRWGAIVFENENYPNSNDDYSNPVATEWDGNSNKGITIGNELPDGTYFVHIKFSNNSSANRIVAVTLQR